MYSSSEEDEEDVDVATQSKPSEPANSPNQPARKTRKIYSSSEGDEEEDDAVYDEPSVHSSCQASNSSDMSVVRSSDEKMDEETWDDNEQSEPSQLEESIHHPIPDLCDMRLLRVKLVRMKPSTIQKLLHSNDNPLYPPVQKSVEQDEPEGEDSEKEGEQRGERSDSQISGHQYVRPFMNPPNLTSTPKSAKQGDQSGENDEQDGTQSVEEDCEQSGELEDKIAEKDGERSNNGGKSSGQNGELVDKSAEKDGERSNNGGESSGQSVVQSSSQSGELIVEIAEKDGEPSNETYVRSRIQPVNLGKLITRFKRTRLTD